MEQPNLGKRISEIRKANGLTQEELAKKCKKSTRTLQRIEAGVVRPRAYTVKVIFAALKEENSLTKFQFEYVKSLFNLKINTMKKVSILSAAILATGLGLLALSSESKAQTEPNVQQPAQQSEALLNQKLIIIKGDTIPNVLTLYQDSLVNKPFLDFLENPKNPEYFALAVANRWGELMHKGNKGWDGIYRGERAPRGERVPEGVYYYVVRLKMNDNEYQQFSGYVTVKHEKDIEKE